MQLWAGKVGTVLMSLRHVLVDGDVTSPLERPAVNGDTLVIMEELDDPACRRTSNWRPIRRCGTE
nr:hypothetical protein [Sinorhizobium americanum]